LNILDEGDVYTACAREAGLEEWPPDIRAKGGPTVANDLLGNEKLTGEPTPRTHSGVCLDDKSVLDGVREGQMLIRTYIESQGEPEERFTPDDPNNTSSSIDAQSIQPSDSRL
jgi:hypothetical protein